jgi:hypothetical protein
MEVGDESHCLLAGSPCPTSPGHRSIGPGHHFAGHGHLQLRRQQSSGGRVSTLQRYSNKPVLGHEIPYGRVWAPGGKPMTLFTNSPIAVAGHDIPAGAYTLFVIPSQKEWALVISKSTDTSGRYDEKDDFLRVAMDFGQLDRAEDQFSIFFAHVAPGQCSMRLDLEKARAWVIFEKR